MTNDPHDDFDEVAAALVISQEVQARLWGIITDPAADYALAPYCVAHAAAELLTNLLVGLTVSRGDDFAFGLRLIDQVQAAFIARTGRAPDATRH
jgi:hypothetical protein